ncbi:PWWP domain-containing protein 6-like [Gastrolobium bilobum]|uniref:PWWP domain-containing protein 6-like n=1 Tax=Gastrolobium bilobum TaxID=150636 RepID=UPI002AB002ED|nr:PWWP domain-containing protein 6-like [Gastrolobium bilobum]
MGTVETQSKVPSGGSSPLSENIKVQGPELEKKELSEVLNGEGSCGVNENGVFSSLGNQGLGDDGVVEVVKSRVFEAKVSVMKENDCQGLADSDMNGVSSLLKMRESGRSAVFSGEGAENLDDVSACERSAAEGTVLSEVGSVGIGGEGIRDGKKSEEEGRDEDCDGKIVTIDVPIVETIEKLDDLSDEGCGKIVTIDVPIVETVEKMDVEVEDLSDEGYEFSIGDFVWGKIKSHDWWPGRVYEPSDASDFALRLKQNDRLLVVYFGEGTFAWCHPSQLKPFEENFDGMVKQNSSRAFVNAVQEAVNEIGRLLNMKLSHSFVSKITSSEFTPPLSKNSGIKEGVLVPENGIERLSAVPIASAELLSLVKQFAQTIAIASILELEILKAHLSAFYLSRGGYKLAVYEDPQPVLGLEDSLTGETVDVGNCKSAVEAPVQGPFEEEYSTLPVSPKFGELCHSLGLSGNRLIHRRKQKSIAEIMGEDKDVHSKDREGDATDEVMDAIGSSGRKKRKGSEDARASKPVQKRKELLSDTDRNVLSAENDGSEGKDSSLQSEEKKEAIGGENISSGNKKEADEEGKAKELNEKGSLSRERKKSKYLSPPFTTLMKGLGKGNIDTESIKEGMTRAASQLSPPVLKRNDEAFQENFSKGVTIEWKLSDSSNYQTQEDYEKRTIDPKKIRALSVDVLSKIRDVAISPQIPRESTSLDEFVDFISVFRSSLYHEGSLYKVYKKRQPGRKRKKLESVGVLRKEQSQSDHMSPDQDSQPTKRRKEATPSMSKVRKAPKTENDKKGSDENSQAAVLFITFWPGSSLPSKSDLITVYSKFGALDETETNMFCTNYTARVSFLRTCDAEKAFKDSQNMNPFRSSDVTFQLQYLSAGSKFGEHGETSKRFKPSPAKKKDKSAASQGSEASKLNFIKQKLQGLTSMLEASDGKSPDMKTKLESEMKGLLEDVNKMVESSSS